MKKLFLFLLMHGSLDSFAQCERSTFVISLSPGITQSGASFAMEAGIWPIEGKVGAMAGPLMYSEKMPTEKGTETIQQIDFLGRVIYKLTPAGSDFPQVVTLFGTVRGLIGASYRAYWLIGESELIGIEPVYVNRLGVGVNILFTTRL